MCVRAHDVRWRGGKPKAKKKKKSVCDRPTPRLSVVACTLQCCNSPTTSQPEQPAAGSECASASSRWVSALLRRLLAGRARLRLFPEERGVKHGTHLRSAARPAAASRTRSSSLLRLSPSLSAETEAPCGTASGTSLTVLRQPPASTRSRFERGLRPAPSVRFR